MFKEEMMTEDLITRILILLRRRIFGDFPVLLASRARGFFFREALGPPMAISWFSVPQVRVGEFTPWGDPVFYPGLSVGIQLDQKKTMNLTLSELSVKAMTIKPVYYLGHDIDNALKIAIGEGGDVLSRAVRMVAHQLRHELQVAKPESLQWQTIDDEENRGIIESHYRSHYTAKEFSWGLGQNLLRHQLDAFAISERVERLWQQSRTPFFAKLDSAARLIQT